MHEGLFLYSSGKHWPTLRRTGRKNLLCILPLLERAKEDRFLYLMLMISSNYGHPKYTCVYGVRIYGQRAN
uniref:Uncharacterized protein n=1 Tax=Sphaerodactylus townsendi TaxID=933632 RepID=A0ACB8FZT5_9SAUR